MVFEKICLWDPGAFKQKWKPFPVFERISCGDIDDDFFRAIPGDCIPRRHSRPQHTALPRQRQIMPFRPASDSSVQCF